MAEPVFTSDQVNYLKEQMPLWLAEQSLGKPPIVYEIELRERMIRVEEELKYQREMIRSILTQMEKRFEQSDKRYEELRLDMNARFEQVDKRFEQIEKRFEQVDKRFDQVERRFEQVERRFEQIDTRFEKVDSRFDRMERRHDQHFLWLMGFIATVGGLVVAAIRLL